MKKISVIIPHYNTPDLLKRCLHSIPDTDNYQVIVVDDNSDPDIVDFSELQKTGRSNTSVVLTKEGKGAGYARNVGLELADGDWLLFADSDDFFVTEMDSILEPYLNSGADMVIFKANSVDSENLEPSDRDENINTRIEEAKNKYISAKQASIAIQSPWCRLIKREFIEKNNIKFEEVMACNDTMFTTMATCLANNIELSSDALYVVTFRKGSLWDSRKTNPHNYLIRIEVQIRRNKYVKKYGFESLPILGYVVKAKDLGVMTFLRALWIAISQRGLLQGINFYFK
ncbi:glycosyltransferase family A protein [Bacteroides faecichinchillae]|uniref:glycosyltransferase family 2 protein n=1 Tax=Bacteroides faecichinchillae TaxID=871325 RepID=UPI003513BDCC